MKKLWAHMTRNQQSGGRDVEKQLSRFSTEESKTFDDLKSKGFGYCTQELLEKSSRRTQTSFNSIMGEPTYEDNEIRYDL